MKKKLSVTVEENSISQIDRFVTSGRFRNRSHMVEFALSQMLKEEQKDE
ncbi:MAG TPA: ribbon-helix-helix domain-containing protein [Candidatus Nanoarchaeia archaeon]|nr:ribbon-helix-helix domain-containing protein [Candidatus Nanoarchaeia archaeon]